MRVTDKVIVVTGGGNGIGQELTLRLLAAGARVAAVDLREEGLAETTRLAGTLAGRLSTHAVDVTDAAAVSQLPDAVIADHGQIDGLVNVAGIIQPFIPFVELTTEQMERVMAVNFWGVVHTCQTFVPHLMTRPEACLVNVSSMGGFAPVPGQTIYGASKAAVKLLTEGLYAELRGTGIAVTVVYPGGVATNITGNSGVALPGGMGADPAADAPTSMTSPSAAARQIIEGIERRAYRVVIGKDARALDAMTRLAPRRATELVARQMAALLDR